MDLQEAFDAGFEAVKAYVDASFDAFEARIGAVEKQLIDAKAPISVTNALIDRTGNLVLTMSDGGVKDMGRIVGKDGKDGEPGLNGAGIDDFDVSLKPDGRTIEMTFNGKDVDYTVELAFPAMIYRGVYNEGEFTRGDTVTWAGSLWHCDAEKTTSKPGDGSNDWTLCAKKGRDGKDGIVKEAAAPKPVRVGASARSE